MNKYETWLKDNMTAVDPQRRLTAADAIELFPYLRDWILYDSWYALYPNTAYFVTGSPGEIMCYRG